MKNSIMNGIIALNIAMYNVAEGNQNQTQIQVGNLKFPALLSQALVHGLNVPVYLKYDQDTQITTQKSNQKIAEAVVTYENGQLFVDKILFQDIIQTTELSKEIKMELETLKKSFNSDMQLKVNQDAYMYLDLKSLYLELIINKNALGTKFISRADVLKPSTSDQISSILNYRLGASYNDYDGRHNSSSYLSLDSISSFREHHLLLNGSVYGVGESNTQGDLYRALYERDFEGNRLAVGMMDTWSMQSIASLNALNSSKIYGVTYGNKSSTTVQDKSQSLIPIVVFLPSAGAVQLYRDGRLLSIQNFTMGSHEIDTSNLPYGIYNIEIKTLINGQESSSTIAQVNKTMGRNSSVTGVLDWQVFAGMMEHRQRPYLDSTDILKYKQTDQKTWLVGVATAMNFPLWSGVGLRSTLYAFNDNAVAEVDTSIVLKSNLTMNFQSMLATDTSYRASANISFELPRGYGSIWGARNISENGAKLYFSETNSYDAGLSLNLSQFNKHLGFFSASYSEDIKDEYSQTNVEYHQNLFSNRYLNMTLRIGTQRSDYRNQQNYDDKYISVDLSMPISKWFSVGVSSHNQNLQANASYKQSFQNSPIRDVGVAVSQVIDRKNLDFQSDDFIASGYMNYETKYNAGSVTVSGSQNSYAVNYTTNGSIAAVGKNIGFGNANKNSGVIIETRLKDKGKMSALINGQDFRLSGRQSYIPLNPYTEYTVELRNDKQSIDSVTIGKGRKSTVVLYPGNVAVIKPEIKQMVTIFGRIYYPDGELASNVNIFNHISKTVTDQYGEFSLDVDKRYPVLTLIESNGDICESKLNLDNVRGAAWLGEIKCNYKAVVGQENILEVSSYE